MYYELGPQEQSSSRGIIEVDPRTSLVTAFFEKPAEGVSSSRFASCASRAFSAATCVVAAMLRPEVRRLVLLLL